jgi:1-acyl-sn-glycerol-3-phosphate acyltransferase
MIKRVDYLWRLFATGGSFAIFYFCSLLMIAIILPILRLIIRDSDLRSEHVRWIINRYFIVFIQFMVLVGVIRIEMYGAERLKKVGKMLIVANHPSYLDVVILLSLIPNAVCIVNNNLLSNPFIGSSISSANYISNSSDAEQLIDNCVGALNRGCPTIIFPEGTRSVPNRALKFHRGFAHIVLKSGVEIQPVIISCEPSFLPKGIPWYKIPKQQPKFVIDVKLPIKAADIIDGTESPIIASRKMEKYLESYYSRELVKK